MTDTESGAIAERIRRLPPDRIREVMDFIAFLESRPDAEAYETMIASEKVLSRDWDTPEEDAVWAGL
ncbi:MAG TPA: DUF2281 domain-containing protein [Desulfobacteraceae bacterium]|nr:DUF2281 domain-containing protein [Desulfobacteraceae bacterium]